MRHALDIVRATRPRNSDSKDFINKWVAFGASVRAQYLVLGGKARALTSGRYHVSFEDIRSDASRPVTASSRTSTRSRKV